MPGLIGSLKVAVRLVLVATLEAPSGGVVEVTVGGVASRETPVVKLQTKSLPEST